MNTIIFDNIKEEILTVLQNAQKNVYAMLAWFTEDDISQKLIDLAKNAVEIKIILSKSEWNLLNKSNLQSLISANVQIRTYGAKTPLEGTFMHHKLCVVDEKIVMNGSYNWTKNASSNKESYNIEVNTEKAQTCLNEFKNLWEKSENINFEDIENSMIGSLEELQQFESQGLNPEQYHTEKPEASLVVVEKPEVPAVVEKIINTPRELSFETLISPLQAGEGLTYNSNLDLFGVEYGRDSNRVRVGDKKFEEFPSWLKLKFKIQGRVIHIAVDKEDFVEFLKTGDNLFKFWDRHKRFSFSMFNQNSLFQFISPLHFEVLDNREFRDGGGFYGTKKHYGKDVSIKMILKVNGMITTRIKETCDTLSELESLSKFSMDKQGYDYYFR